MFLGREWVPKTRGDAAMALGMVAVKRFRLLDTG